MFYFDNAATSFPKPEEVYSYSDEYYRNSGFNAKRSHIGENNIISPLDLISTTKDMLLDLLNARGKKIAFLSSATEAMNVVLQGIDFNKIKRIYITPFEHNAVIRTLHYLNSIYDFEVIELSMDNKIDKYDIEAIKYQFQKYKPDLIVMNHASNVTGLIAPIGSICKLAKEYDAITVIDIAQSAGQIEIDLESNVYDFVIFAGHKSLLASFGVGGFISNGRVILKPLLYGGTGIDSANPELPNDIPERYEVGSTNILAISSMYASLKYIDRVGLTNLIYKKKVAMNKLLSILEEYPGVKIYRKKEHNDYVNLVSINYSGYSSDNIGDILSRMNILVRTGLHCAPNAHRYLGTFPEGTVRLSVGSFTTDKDLKKLQEALDYIEDNS